MGQIVVELVAGAKLVITIDVGTVLSLIEAQEERAKNINPLLLAIAKTMREAEGEKFATAGDGTWAPLADSTVASKTEAGLPALTKKGNVPWRLKQNGNFGAGNILIGNGKLRDSYRLKNVPDHVEIIDEQTGSVTVGSSNPVAKFHQFGTQPYTIRPKTAKMLSFIAGGGKRAFAAVVHHPGLPARPVLLNNDDRQKIAGLIYNWFSGGDIGGSS